MFSYLKTLNSHKFNHAQEVIITTLFLRANAWGIDPATIQNLQAVQTTWESNYIKSLNPTLSTPSVKYARDTAHVELAKLLSDVILDSVYNNPAVTDMDILLMELPVDGKITMRKKPDYRGYSPIIKISAEKKRLKVKAYIDDTYKSMMPSRYHLLQIKYAVDGEPLDYKNGIDLFATKSHSSHEILKEARGKVISVIARWINPDGTYTDFCQPEKSYLPL